MTVVDGDSDIENGPDLGAIYQEWKEFIQAVDDLIQQHELSGEVVFHGTSSGPFETISIDGLKPTSVTEAFLEEPNRRRLGSFWGQVTTAGWYAFDNIENRHPFDKPVLLMAFADQLETWGEFYTDKYSIEHPVDERFKSAAHRYLPALDDGTLELAWQEGLREIGAVFLLHSDDIPTTEFKAVRSLEEVVAILKAAHALKPAGPAL